MELSDFEQKTHLKKHIQNYTKQSLYCESTSCFPVDVLLIRRMYTKLTQYDSVLRGYSRSRMQHKNACVPKKDPNVYPTRLYIIVYHAYLYNFIHWFSQIMTMVPKMLGP